MLLSFHSEMKLNYHLCLTGEKHCMKWHYSSSVPNCVQPCVQWHIYTLSELPLITEEAWVQTWMVWAPLQSLAHKTVLCVFPAHPLQGVQEKNPVCTGFMARRKCTLSLPVHPNPFGKHPRSISGALFQSSIYIGKPLGFLGMRSLMKSPCRTVLRTVPWKLLI